MKILTENAMFFMTSLTAVGISAALLFFVIRHYKLKKPDTFLFTFAANLSVALFLFSTAFFLLETYYRFIYDSTDSLISTRCCLKWFQKYYRTNMSGFRDNVEYDKDIKPGKTKITFVGDSFTAGHGIRNIEDRFVNIIRGKNNSYDVQMLAIPGFETAEEINILKRAFASGYRTNAVILIYCLNDINESNPYISKSIEEAQASEKKWYRFSYFLDHLMFQIKFKTDPAIRNYSHKVLSQYKGEEWDRQKARLLQMRDTVLANGSAFAVVTFPFMQNIPDYEYAGIHSALNAFWAEANVPHIDLLETFSKAPRQKLVVSIYDAHPNEAANRIAAEAIDKFLKDVLSGSKLGHNKNDNGI